MPCNNIADIFDRIVKRDALIIGPATQKNIDRCNEDLDDIDCPLLPDEYEEFLRLANGFAWNGFEFYGTYAVKEVDTGYILQDIVGFNERYEFADDILIVGKFDEDYYVYNDAKKVFQSYDRLTRLEAETYDSFMDLIMGTVAIYAFADE